MTNSNNLIQVGRTLFAVGLIGIGVLNLIYGDFALQWVPVAEWVPARQLLAYLTGLILVISGIATFVPRTRAMGTSILAALIWICVLVLHAPRVALQPLNVGEWLGLAEPLALAGGVWILTQPSFTEILQPTLPNVFKNRARFGYLCFAVALPIFGLSHFMYADFTASMIPAWIPGHLFFAYFTGAGHLAAGIALLTGVLSRLAAILIATMFSSFIVLLHIPRVLASPTNRVEWTMLCVATALTGAAWVVAATCSATFKKS